MKIEPRKLKGVFEITLAPRGDHRGYFMRVWDRQILAEAGLDRPWVQENEAYTKAAHTLRGLHYQRPPSAETKLVRAAAGAIFDVFVDLRRGSPTYGQWDGLELSAEKHNAVLIPRGFAHGYCTLTPDSLVTYKVDSYYAPSLESGVRWNDPAIGIRWPVSDPILSDRDKVQPLLAETEPLDPAP